MLPGMDGLDVCRALKKNDKTQGLPIVILTAKGEESDVVTGLELGADDYIVKPFSPKILAARIKSVLRRKSAGFPCRGSPGIWVPGSAMAAGILIPRSDCSGKEKEAGADKIRTIALNRPRALRSES